MGDKIKELSWTILRGSAPLVYIAGPVRAIGREEAVRLRESLERFLVARGCATFNPPGAWGSDLTDPVEKRLQEVNDQIIMSSDLMVVVGWQHHESKGTAHEVRLALRKGIPVVLMMGSVEQADAYLTQYVRAEQSVQHPTCVYVRPTLKKGETVYNLWFKPHMADPVEELLK